MSLERLDKRFGIAAIERGFITPEQLYEAIKIQVMEELEGAKRQLIGEILREKEYITNLQIDEVLLSMGIKLSNSIIQ
jgi:hypothetical protein